MVLGWSLCAGGLQPLYGAGVHGAVRHRAAGEFHEDRHLRVPPGDDLGNLVALLRILLEQHPVPPPLGGALTLFLCWRFALSRWILRTLAATAAFFALCVFATQTGNKLLGPNIRYVDRAVNYHRDIIRSGPGLYLFNLVDDAAAAACFAIPADQRVHPQLSHVSLSQPPRFDLRDRAAI